MELLEKTRKINRLLQREEKVEYNAIAEPKLFLHHQYQMHF